MWAPVRIDHALGNKRLLVFRASLVAAEHVLAHGQPRGDERVTAGVAELGTIEVEAPADLRSREPDLALCGETVAAEHGAVDPQPIGEQGESAAVVESRALKAEQPADVTAEHNPAICREAVALHVLIDLQAIGDQGRAGVVAQLRPGAVQVAADVAADDADRASLAGADGGEPAAEEHGLAHLQP